ncbi:hypothetical protein KAFR_0D04880 [Kazachstania africana CBS 2517]|uniref:Chromatin modification-related protein n=1 Tax=Kazachstania africana (strain ATCC 22294 / BCRC 22015 / CBS 2517 / CECT 1963 / NBRC 1671 / NRRL Y-8276) TaxID=1071382 RepID=H2AUT5_KAZAF|nr:hypothetical protein KAFR_0D04880 [Kazachstania africana CBS 2517]CCF58135.1 hypothetical protein KAFR_0D04880 [Kazachstania africana CBS 2517]
MDPSLALEQTLQDISNLEAEFHHAYEEIGANDGDIQEHQKKYMQKDSQIQKFIKQNGAIAEHPNESELNRDMQSELKEMLSLQKEKCKLANTALFMVAKHLSKLERNLTILEEDGVLAPMEEDEDQDIRTELSRESSVLSTTSERKRRASPSVSSSVPPLLKKKRQLKAPSLLKQSTSARQDQKSALSSPDKSNAEVDSFSGDLFSGGNENEEEEEEDKKLYCFCQSVSYGEMVACDGPHCKYEWFHYACVNLKEPPKGTWYCPDCKQEMAKNKLKRKKV